MEHFFNMKFKTRQANFELLRLFSMILVPSMHFVHRIPYLYWGHPQFKSMQALETLTYFCDHEFILLSGAFGFKNRMRVSRLIPIILEAQFYSLFFYFKAKHNNEKISESFYYYLFPVSNEIYWFNGPFLISQLFLYPFAKGIKSIGKFYHLFICILIFACTVLQTANYAKTFLAPIDYGMNIIMFLMLLPIGMYIGFYDVKLNPLLALVGFIGTFSIQCKARFGTFDDWLKIHPDISKVLKNDTMVAPLSTISGIFVFLFFKGIKIPKYLGYIINFLADHCFACYLIHVSPLSGLMWGSVGKIKEEGNIALNILKVSADLMFKCIGIDIIRDVVFNVLIYKRKYYAWICKVIDNLFENSEEKRDDEGLLLQKEDEKTLENIENNKFLVCFSSSDNDEENKNV